MSPAALHRALKLSITLIALVAAWELLCRALNIPARLATGIDYGADPALGPTDFHCYVEAFLGDRWYTVEEAGASGDLRRLKICEADFEIVYGSHPL